MTINVQQKNKLTSSRFSPAVASLLLLVFILACLILIFKYVDNERDRDLLSWQSRLALLAEIRASAVEDLILNRKNQLEKLADNTSLKLFLSEYENKTENNRDILNVQQAHVRNLLRASAEWFGFSENNNKNNSLNLNSSNAYGIAILDSQQQLLMSTKGLSKNINQEVIKKAFVTAQQQIISLYADQNQQPVYGFVVPVFKIQDTQEKIPVGAVMLLLNPQKYLYVLLQNKQSVTKTDESLLVKAEGSSLVYLSPIKDDLKLFHQLPNNNSLASSYAFHHAGGFAQMHDYRGELALVTGRKIKNSPWYLVQKISASEALSESDEHQTFLLTTFILFVLMIAAAFIAIWRHSTSMRLQILSHALETRTALLDAVTNNIQENIILIDKDKRVEFINLAFAQILSVEAEEIQTKNINNVLGKETADRLMAGVVQQKNASVMTLNLGDVERIYHVTFSQLIAGEHQHDTLFVLHDISELKAEQEKRELLGKGIISTLVKAVDLHDPHCANHSARTRDVSMAIAREMQLDEAKLESLEMASLLANIGKLFVSKEILTKMQPLSDEESVELKRHIEYAVDILSELAFNGPVVDIIAQKNERLDGSGYPNGLSGDEIMLESRILAVANAFVAMASARAYRQGHKVNAVIDILLEQSENQYDRHVVAALFHIAENKADWQTWQSI